jgi:hypothetical protein
MSRKKYNSRSYACYTWFTIVWILILKHTVFKFDMGEYFVMHTINSLSAVGFFSRYISTCVRVTVHTHTHTHTECKFHTLPVPLMNLKIVIHMDSQMHLTQQSVSM